MAMDFASILSTPPSGRRTAVVIDHQQYAQAVILQGRPVPWSDPVAYAQYTGQAQGLLRPDTTLLDLGAFHDHALSRSDALRTSLSARKRPGYALRTLLAHEPTAARAVELAGVLARTSGAPLVVQVPSPLLWLARTHGLSGAGPVTGLDARHAENAAVYLADWLRRLSALPVSMLLLDERRAGPGQLPPVEDAAYQPVANIADHYRWALGLRTPAGIGVVGSGANGVAVPPQYWRDDDAKAPTGDFLVADIPADAVPETVLSQLAKID